MQNQKFLKLELEINIIGKNDKRYGKFQPKVERNNEFGLGGPQTVSEPDGPKRWHQKCMLRVKGVKILNKDELKGKYELEYMDDRFLVKKKHLIFRTLKLII